MRFSNSLGQDADHTRTKESMTSPIRFSCDARSNPGLLRPSRILRMKCTGIVLTS